jgi:molybdopterin molybdotransferase
MGEDIQKGDIVLRSGITIKPWHMGVMATTGITDVNVYRKINVGIISTGDELQEPGEVLEEGKIFNSNAWQLIGSCFSANTHPIYYGIVEDNLKATTEIILNAISENDIVLLTGGVSMGDYDFVPQALKNAGFIIKFDSVAMQPGRPLTYATDGQKHCFGLPGNPVSVLVQFELSVKPLIYKLMGHDFAPSHIPLKMGKTITRKKTQRKSFYPVSLNHDHTVTAVSYHGSAHINAFSDAYGIIAMDEGVSEIREGEIVYVRPL